MALADWRHDFVPDTTARALLADETLGMAIDATTLGTAEFTGGPVGGTIAIKDDDRPHLAARPLDAAAELVWRTSPLTQSGTSPKMVHYPSSPYVRWTPHNLFVQSQTFGTTWAATNTTVGSNTTIAPDGTTTADTLTSDGTASSRIAQQPTSPAVGFPVTFSLYIKAGTVSWCALQMISGANHISRYFDIGNGVVGSDISSGGTLLNSGIESVGSGWYRIFITGAVLATNQDYVIYHSNADNTVDVEPDDTLIVWGGQLNRGSTPTPYITTTSAAKIGIPFGYDTAAAQYGILCEPAATNLCTYSEAPNEAAWTKTNVDVSANSTTAPDGTSTADKVSETAGAGNTAHQVDSVTMTVSSAAQYTLSIYAKAAELEWIAFFPNNETAHAYFHLSGAGSVGTVGANNDRAAITSVGNGWYRCEVEFTTTDTSRFLSVAVTTADNVYTYDAGAGGNGVYVWGAQCEAGSVATSYIPTLGATATRAVDVIEAATSSVPFSATVGTGIVLCKTRTTSGYAQPWELSNGTADERMATYAETADRQWHFLTQDGGVEQDNVDSGVNVTVNTIHGVSVAWQANDSELSVDGAAPTAGDGTSTIPTPTEFEFGDATWAGTVNLNGFIYQFIYLPRHMTDAELQVASTP